MMPRLRRGIFNYQDPEQSSQILNPMIFDDEYDQEQQQQDDLFGDESESDQANAQAKSGVTNRFNEIFNAARDVPEGPANTNYRKFLENEMPVREPPGKINRLAAILGGASEGFQRGASAGIRTAQDTLEAPYERKLRDYTVKGRALQGAAALEDKSLGRAASFARSATNAEIAQDKIKQQAADRQARINNWAATNKVRVDAMKKMGITHTLNDVTGELTFSSPDGTKVNVGKVGSTLDDRQKGELKKFYAEQATRHANTLSEQENQAGLTQIGANKTQAAIAAREAAGRADVTARGEATPQTRDREVQLKMKQFLAKNGDAAKSYFIIDADGIPTALKPGDPDDEDYRAIYNFLYGKKK